MSKSGCGWRSAALAVGCAVLLVPSALVADIRYRVSAREKVYQVEEAGGALWIAADSGLSVVDQAGVTEPVLADSRANVVLQQGLVVWVGTESGAFKIVGDEPPEPVQELAGVPVRAISLWLGSVWFGTGEGLYRLPPSGAGGWAVEDVNLLSLLATPERLWGGTVTGTIHLALPEPFELGPEQRLDHRVDRLIEAGESIWAVTSDLFSGQPSSVHRLSPDGRFEPFASRVLRGVADVAEVGAEEVWFATVNGLIGLPIAEVADSPADTSFRSVPLQPVDLGSAGARRASPAAPASQGDAVNKIEVFELADGGEEVWVGTVTGLFRRARADGRFEQVPRGAEALAVAGIVQAGGKTWHWSEEVDKGGAYVVEEGFELAIDPAFAVGSYVLGKDLEFHPPTFRRLGSSEVLPRDPEDVKLRWKTGKDAKVEDLVGADLVSWNLAKVSIPDSPTRVLVTATDGQGNRQGPRSYNVRRVRLPFIATVVAIIGGVLTILGILFGWFRKIGRWIRRRRAKGDFGAEAQETARHEGESDKPDSEVDPPAEREPKAGD